MLDGAAPVPEGTLRIPVVDRGFLYGEAAFETMVGTVTPAGDARVDALEAHLRRLRSSCAPFGVPDMSAPVRSDLRHLLPVAGPGRQRIRVVVTAGEGGRLDGEGAGPAHRLVSTRPLRPYPARLYDDGAAAVLLVGRGSSVPGAKLVSYAGNIDALRRAREAGAHEALLTDGAGRVLEGATSNVFAVCDGVLRTPGDAGILPGITRAQVLALAAEAALPCAAGPLSSAALVGAQEAFLTSTVRGVMPLTRLDGRPLGSGAPGPLTRRLAAAWAAEAGARSEVP
ncbi:MAG: aminotransferase class IV [Myxococcota bacterium]